LTRAAAKERRNVPLKRQIKILDLITDIRAGMTDEELMKKYALSRAMLQKTFTRLADFYRRLPFQAEGTPADQRKLPRNYPAISVTVREAKNPVNSGVLRDVNEQGLGLRDLDVKVDDFKTLEIVPNQFNDLDTIVLEAKCVWTRVDMPGGSVGSGFEVTKISEDDLGKLREMIRSLTLEIKG
jgi:PilZ domain